MYRMKYYVLNVIFYTFYFIKNFKFFLKETFKKVSLISYKLQNVYETFYITNTGTSTLAGDYVNTMTFNFNFDLCQAVKHHRYR